MASNRSFDCDQISDRVDMAIKEKKDEKLFSNSILEMLKTYW